MTRQIKCTLTKADKAKKADQITATLAEVDALVVDRKALNADIRDKRGAVTKLADEHRTGEETRAVECEERHDPRTRRVVTIRLDSGAEVDERAMTDDELQEVLPMLGGKDGGQEPMMGTPT